MTSKAEQRAARQRVSAYHESQLAELISHVETVIDRYRSGETDAYAVDETIHHYHRAAGRKVRLIIIRRIIMESSLNGTDPHATPACPPTLSVPRPGTSMTSTQTPPASLSATTVRAVASRT